jgi:hypothetical protein
MDDGVCRIDGVDRCLVMARVASRAGRIRSQEREVDLEDKSLSGDRKLTLLSDEA